MSNTNRTIGIILCVLGVLGIAWGGFRYRTGEKRFAVGSFRITREDTRNVPVSPIAGGLALIGGVLLLAAGGKSRNA